MREQDPAAGTQVKLRHDGRADTAPPRPHRTRPEQGPDEKPRDKCPRGNDDPDCKGRTATTPKRPPSPDACHDPKDNDGDSYVDAADQGCKADTTEAPRDVIRPNGCIDRKDNDDDNQIDGADPRCVDGGTVEAPFDPIID